MLFQKDRVLFKFKNCSLLLLELIELLQQSAPSSKSKIENFQYLEPQNVLTAVCNE